MFPKCDSIIPSFSLFLPEMTVKSVVWNAEKYFQNMWNTEKYFQNRDGERTLYKIIFVLKDSNASLNFIEVIRLRHRFYFL